MWNKLNKALKYEKWIYKMVVILLLLSIALAITAWIILRAPKFGQSPQDELLAQITSSPNYTNGQFHNLIPTQKLTNDSYIFSILWNDFFMVIKKPSPVRICLQ